MPAPLKLDTFGPAPLALTSEWVTVRSGRSDSTLPGSSTSVIVSVSAAPTPSAVTELRVRSLALDTATAARPVTELVTHSFGHTVAASDIVELQARRVSGTGGIMIFDVGALQGATVGAVTPDPVTETGIVTQPQSVVTSGAAVVLSVVAVGVNLSYQWEVDTGGGWGNTGTDSATLSTSTAGDYRVTVTGDNDPVGGPVESDVATVTVSTTTAVVIAEPADTTVIAGSSGLFTIVVNNLNSWEMYERTTGTGDGTLVASGTNWTSDTVTYQTPPAPIGDDGNEYRFTVQGTDAVDVFSRWALLTVTEPATAAGLLVTDTEVDD